MPLGRDERCHDDRRRFHRGWRHRSKRAVTETVANESSCGCARRAMVGVVAVAVGSGDDCAAAFAAVFVVVVLLSSSSLLLLLLLVVVVVVVVVSARAAGCSLFGGREAWRIMGVPFDVVSSKQGCFACSQERNTANKHARPRLDRVLVGC